MYSRETLCARVQKAGQNLLQILEHLFSDPSASVPKIIWILERMPTVSTFVLYLPGRGKIINFPQILANILYYFELILRTIEHEMEAKPPTELRHIGNRHLRDIGLSKADATMMEFGIEPHRSRNRFI